MKWNNPELIAILDRASRDCSLDGYHFYLQAERTGITRFANSEITDNQFFSDARLTIRSYAGSRIGVATVNQLADDPIREGIRRSEQMARLSPENPEFTGPPTDQDFPKVPESDPATAETPPIQRAELIAAAVRESQERRLTAAGYLHTGEEIAATLSSAGGPACHRRTTAQFSMSAKTADGSGSGWVLRWAGALADLDIAALARTAMDKAEASRDPVALAPGRYTVVLEPVACEYLLWNLTHHFDARAAAEGRSFLARFDGNGQAAGTRVGESVFSPLLTLGRQVSDSRLRIHPFDEVGVARRDLDLVTNGVVENLAYDPYWADRSGVRATGGLEGMHMAGSDRSTADLIRSVANGILVTRLWYIRTVDWMKSAMTGMTRDGTFRIVGGEIAEPVKNFRFNEELRRIFRDLTAVGTPQRFWDFLSPAVVVPDFNFTSTTESI